MAYRRKIAKEYRCPLEYALDVLGGKWKSRVLFMLSDGTCRYSELREKMICITDAALAVALKDLQRDGLVRRRQYEEIPPRVEYELTERGESVIPVLHHMCRWTGLNRDETNATVPHCQHCEDWREE